MAEAVRLEIPPLLILKIIPPRNAAAILGNFHRGPRTPLRYGFPKSAPPARAGARAKPKPATRLPCPHPDPTGFSHPG